MKVFNELGLQDIMSMNKETIAALQFNKYKEHVLSILRLLTTNIEKDNFEVEYPNFDMYEDSTGDIHSVINFSYSEAFNMDFYEALDLLKRLSKGETC